MALPFGLTIRAVDPPGPSVSMGVVGSLAQSRSGGSSASASSGGGGWQVVDRALQRASTEWLDYYPMVLSGKVILDGGELPAASIEVQIAIMESWELPAPGTTPPRPPILWIAGPVPHTTSTWWVLSKLAFTGGDTGSIRDPNTGQRTQQWISLELTEYSPPSVLISGLSPAQIAAQQSSSITLTTPGGTPGTGNAGSGNAPPAGQGTSTPPASGSTYTVVAGDTLSGIAARVLGDASLWVALASLNGIRDPNSIAPGQILKLPASGSGGGALTPAHGPNYLPGSHSGPVAL